MYKRMKGSRRKKKNEIIGQVVRLISVSFFIATILAWVLIVIVGLGFLPIGGDELTLASEPSLLRGVFATLFALTVPHIVVVDFLFAPKDRSELMELDRSEFTT